jgi:hypothetical protein
MSASSELINGHASAQADGSGARDVRSTLSPVSLAIGEVLLNGRLGRRPCSETCARSVSGTWTGVVNCRGVAAQSAGLAVCLTCDRVAVGVALEPQPERCVPIGSAIHISSKPHGSRSGAHRISTPAA